MSCGYVVGVLAPLQALEMFEGVEDACARARTLCQLRRHRGKALVVAAPDGTTLGMYSVGLTWAELSRAAKRRERQRCAEWDGVLP